MKKENKVLASTLRHIKLITEQSDAASLALIPKDALGSGLVIHVQLNEGPPCDCGNPGCAGKSESSMTTYGKVVHISQALARQIAHDNDFRKMILNALAFSMTMPTTKPTESSSKEWKRFDDKKGGDHGR